MGGMRFVSCAVVDDDDDDAAVTAAMVERYVAEQPLDDAGPASPRHTLVRFADGRAFLDACDAAKARPFDLVFLDVEMPGIDGLETARLLRERDASTVIVFTTKMAQYATVGYDVDAVGYLVKPLDYPGFALRMRKALRLVDAAQGTTVAIASDDHMRFLDSRDIRYVEVTGHSVLYHTGRGVWRDWGTLKAVAERLVDHHFVFSNRYCLVNLAWVEALDGDTIVVDGERLTVSRSRKKPLMQALNRFHGAL